MLLLPSVLNKTPGKVFFPYGLLILTILSVAFYLTFQLENKKYNIESINYYFKNNIDEFEVPHYVKFIKKYMQNELYFNLLNKLNQGKITKIELYWIMRDDALFQDCLETEKCVTDNTLAYLKWREHRREFINLVSKDGYQNFGFKPGNPNGIDLVASLILYKNPFDLIVSLLFLIAIGALIEAQIGTIRFIIVYGICSLMMISVYTLLAQYTLMPIGGAIGGVSGLIGFALTCYRNDIVNWHYFALNQIKSLNAKVFYMIGIWVLCNIGLIIISTFDWVNICAQASALFTGVLLGLMAHSNTDTPSIKHDDRSDLKIRLNNASSLASKMEYAEAKTILYRLLDEYPNNKEVLFHIYNLEKMKPESEEYHNIVQKIFSLKDLSQTTTAMINLVFKNYIRRAKPSIRFDVYIFADLLHRFRKFGYNDDAEKILKVLARYNKDGKLSEALAREQLLLARNYIAMNDMVQGNRLIQSLLEEFPKTKSAQDARVMVSQRHMS